VSQLLIALIDEAVSQAFKIHMAKMKLIVDLGHFARRKNGAFAAYLRLVEVK
jgi:hypothetical protein